MPTDGAIRATHDNTRTPARPRDAALTSVRLRVATALLLSVSGLAGCGARTAVEVDPTGFDAGRPPLDDEPGDAGEPGDARPEDDVDGSVRDAGPDACVPIEDECGVGEACNDGADDDCDGAVDEGCGCEPGAVQGCFAASRTRRNVGACQDGEQVCGSDREWGPCLGGVLPNRDLCTGRDDLCDGCSDERVCGIDCPSPGDARVPVGRPFEAYALEGRAFFVGPAASWRWQIQGGPCDRLAPRLESFELTGASSESAVFTPRLSGEYRITLSVTAPDGEVFECSWVVQVVGPGLRVELCYPESETLDLDLFLHRPNDTQDWYLDVPPRPTPLPEASCGWHNCEPIVRLASHPVTGETVERADWGYADSPLARCENGPLGDLWRDSVGVCPNPRLDIDNNLRPGRVGLPENINVDQPRDGERFRILVRNFSGGLSRPVVNVYCGGQRVATFGAAPDTVPGFSGPVGGEAIGAFWHVADVTPRVDATGLTTSCDVQQLHPEGSADGFRVTVNDGRF